VPHPEVIAGQDCFVPELSELEESERLSVCEILDRVLNKGVVIAGEVTISVAGVDLLYLGLQLVLTSIETARDSMQNGQPAGGLSLDIGKRRSHGAA
jgi:gas vesicle structural protein